jgi:hypothetical protein
MIVYTHLELASSTLGCSLNAIDLFPGGDSSESRKGNCWGSSWLLLVRLYEVGTLILKDQFLVTSCSLQTWRIRTSFLAGYSDIYDFPHCLQTNGDSNFQTIFIICVVLVHFNTLMTAYIFNVSLSFAMVNHSPNLPTNGLAASHFSSDSWRIKLRSQTDLKCVIVYKQTQLLQKS